ncbi:secreted RxLR effector protein 161-like [Schistocerca piceifrons]|uniref:secreted RxLR effector protein 161-like n=1 Tax=Schistocerca piceifrons TaxID=274613 RepID=UPI001F5E8DF0|nr:secreted RxLR effector protein 161-like [Schistocerca piceifrons]
MEHCTPVAYPFEPGSNLQKCENKLTDEENLVLHRIPYQQAVGSLLYLAQSTRPYVSYAVEVLSRFNSNYRKIHWEAVKRIMQYIKGTVNVGQTFRKSGTTEIESFCDADYASDLHQWLSTTGYIFKLAGTAVSWTSKRQQTVALSTTEAEYMALSAAGQKAVYLQGLLRELCVTHSEKSVSVCCDNRDAIALCHNGVHHPRTKHIDVRHHYIRDLIKTRKFSVKPVNIDKQQADFLTKVLPKRKHQWCCQAVGLSEFTN